MGRHVADLVRPLPDGAVDQPNPLGLRRRIKDAATPTLGAVVQLVGVSVADPETARRRLPEGHGEQPIVAATVLRANTHDLCRKRLRVCNRLIGEYEVDVPLLVEQSQRVEDLLPRGTISDSPASCNAEDDHTISFGTTLE